MTLEVIITLSVLGAFGLLLYIGPSYFRWLRKFIERLESKHQSVFEKLHRPNLSIGKITMESGFATTRYIVGRGYRRLHDASLTEIGEAARWRLLLHLAVVISIGIVGPILYAIVK
jgi:hypothetical protein